MSRVTNLVTTVGALLGVVLVFVPAFFTISHSQALTNVLVGQFGAMAIGHSAYRVAYGKNPSARSAIAAILCGVILAVSPIVFGLVDGFTTITMVGGGVIALAGVLALLSARSSDDRNIPELSADREGAEEPVEPA